MNLLNLVAYAVYLIITFFITVRVGWICYKNGIHFIELELEDKTIADSVNKLLLIGYYLLNLGYASIMIYSWQSISTLSNLLSDISTKSAMIILSLGILHYINLLIIYLARKRKQHHSSIKK